MKIRLIFLGVLEYCTIPIYASPTVHNVLGVVDIGTIVALITSFLTFLGILLAYWQFRRKQFTDTITKERLNFIKEWRDCAICLCTLLSGNSLNQDNKSTGQPLDYFYYKLLLMCNSNKKDAYVDNSVVKMLKKLREDYKNKQRVDETELDDFVALMQANIEIEWKGTELESRKGKLTAEQKESLRKECYFAYEGYLNRKYKK